MSKTAILEVMFKCGKTLDIKVVSSLGRDALIDMYDSLNDGRPFLAHTSRGRRVLLVPGQIAAVVESGVYGE